MRNLISLKKFDEVATATDTPGEYWIQAWRYSEWEHPQYGTVVVDRGLADRLKENFDAKVYGQDIPLNFEHGTDVSKGKQAAGWIHEIQPREEGVFYRVEFTEDALAEVKAGKWRYISPEYDDYIDPETKQEFKDVPMGAALTVRPFFKNMAPLNFSEYYESIEDPKEKFHVESIPHHKERKSDVNELELIKKFAELLGIATTDDDTVETVQAKVKTFAEVVEPLRRVKTDAETTKTFAEQFPDEYARMQKLESDGRENDARKFSETFARFIKVDGENKVPSDKGFSAVVLTQIEAAHKAFAEGTATPETLSELLEVVASDEAIVDFVETGSARVPESDDKQTFSGEGNSRKQFAEVVAGFMSQDGMEYDKAVELAAKDKPELFEAYQNIRQS